MRPAPIETLLKSAEPSVRFKVLVHVLGEGPKSKKVRALQDEIRKSPRVRTLLKPPRRAIHVYSKWQGAHWVLATLADIGYPPGDKAIAPLVDRVLDCWLRPRFFEEFQVQHAREVYKQPGVPCMNGRYRRCGSQQGSALLSATRLGFTDKRCNQLVERLKYWQWPDGGWNCDKNPSADTSSFMETLLPMRGLFAFGEKKTALRAVEVFLSRKLFKRRADGSLIHREFTRLHYPLYWHYDILAGLKAMAEMKLIRDPRCADALDLLESKQLPDGGWPAQSRYYKKVSTEISLGTELVDWGGTSARRMNEWVTADALAVLRAAGRIRV